MLVGFLTSQHQVQLDLLSSEFERPPSLMCLDVDIVFAVGAGSTDSVGSGVVPTASNYTVGLSTDTVITVLRAVFWAVDVI